MANDPKKSFTPFNAGYSLVEILVILAVVGLMGLGTTSMVNNMLRLGQKNEMNSGIRTFKANLETMIRNEDSWMNTIKNTGGAAPGLLSCIWEGDNIQCNDGLPVNNFDVYDRNPAPNPATPPPGAAVPIFYQASDVTAGFNTLGQPCNGASPGGGYTAAGNDSCPFRFDISATLACPNGNATCLKPTVTITGTLRVSPATDVNLANRVNLNEYNFTIVKTDEVRFEPLEIRYTRFDGGPGFVGTPCGAPGVLVPRPLSDIAYDVGSNVIGPIAAGNSFTLASGIYSCEIAASAYEAVNGFNIFLEVGGTPQPIGSGFSGLNSTATAVGKIDLDLPANTQIRVMHQCNAPGPGNNPNFDMGIPSITGAAANYSAGNTFTRVTCIRNR